MLDPAAFRLYTDKPWGPPIDVGEFFTIPSTALTETEQKSAHSEWKTQEDLRDTFKNVHTALKEMLERTIDEVYHSATMGRRGFGNDDPPAIVGIRSFKAKRGRRGSGHHLAPTPPSHATRSHPGSMDEHKNSKSGRASQRSSAFLERN